MVAVAQPMLELPDERITHHRRPALVVVAGGRGNGTRSQPPAVYRWRRLIVAAVVAAFVWASASAWNQVTDPGAGGTSPSGVASLEPGTTYVVQPGDTLWAIAERLAPSGDVRAVVDSLIEANGGPALEVGTRLELPAI